MDSYKQNSVDVLNVIHKTLKYGVLMGGFACAAYGISKFPSVWKDVEQGAKQATSQIEATQKFAPLVVKETPHKNKLPRVTLK